MNRKDDIENYQYIGELNIEYRNMYNKLFLPYEKPDEITTVFESAYEGLIIDEIIVDNVIITPQDDITGIFEPMGSEKSSVEKNNKIEMLWEVRQELGSMYDENINKGIYFLYFNYFLNKNILEYSLQPYSYNIPYGSKEIKLKYRICYPEGIIGETIYYIKFNLIWPEIRITDDNGNIIPPKEYIDLGLSKLNNDFLSVELPFIRHGYEPEINNRWLLIYELICDGKNINKEEVNSQENENIDSLTEKEGIKPNSNTTEMIWLINGKVEDGLVFYSKAERPPIKYNIPYSSKEIYMTYDIMFFTSVGYSIHNDRICIKWEIEW